MDDEKGVQTARGFQSSMHDDDQIVPIGASAMRSSRIVKASTLKVYPGLSHGMCSTNKEQISADLLAFLRPEGKEVEKLLKKNDRIFAKRRHKMRQRITKFREEKRPRRNCQQMKIASRLALLTKGDRS